MFDLNMIHMPCASADARTRLALVHHSFRAVSVRRGIGRQTFAAHFPALGLLNLAQSLRIDMERGAVAPVEMKYFDQEDFDDEREMREAVVEWLEDADRRVVAATSYTSTIDHLEAFFDGFDPTRHLLVVGGPHVSLAPDIENCHIVVRGEGGAAVRHIIQRFGQADFGTGPDAHGICYRVDGVATLSKQHFDNSIEHLPPPAFAYDLLPPVDHNIYSTNFTRMLGVSPQVYVCTQSCRARCTFCSTYLIHGKSVARPVQLIEEDLRIIVSELGHDSIEFHDDDLMQHPDLSGLLDVIGATGVPWFCYARVDQIDPDLASRLAAAGCRRIFLGIESMQQAKLNYFNKAATVEQNRQAADNLAAARIGVVAGLIIGAPADTVDSILDDLDAYLELPLLAINCSILSPDPGTIEFRRARERPELRIALGGESGKRLIPDVARYGLDAPVGLPTVARTISKSTLNLLQAVIDAAFYARPAVWEGLSEGKTADQLAMLGAYYRHVGEQLISTPPGVGHARLRETHARAMDAILQGPWLAPPAPLPDAVAIR